MPAPLERFEVRHPAVPEALDGLSVLHLADLHVRARRPNSRVVRQLLRSVAEVEVDLVCLGGDYAENAGDGEAATEVVAEVVAACRARLGCVGVFGNHDDGRTRDLMRERIGGVQWIEAGVEHIGGMRVFGASYPEDALSAARALAEGGSKGAFVLGLVHHPTGALAMAQLGAPIVLAAHTHGGQWRFGPSLAPHTSCDLPAELAWGIVRFGGSLVCTTRGIGTAAVHFRINCPAHAPVYVLRRGEVGVRDRGAWAERLVDF